MAQNREPFLSRWSRRKRAAEQSAAEPKPPANGETRPPPELPPVDSLTPDSDFSVFMHKQVDEKLRRAALKKLFSDPAFNVVDGLDDYAEDFTQLETLAEGAAAGLEHAKRTLFGGDAQAEPPAQAEAEAPASTEAQGSDPARLAEKSPEADETPEAANGVPPPAASTRQNKA